MNANDMSRQRLMSLLHEAEFLRKAESSSEIGDVRFRERCMGWLTAAQNLGYQLILDPVNPYRMKLNNLAMFTASRTPSSLVGEGAEVLLNLARDLDAGLVNGIISAAQAEIFDDFLEHAEHYMKGGRTAQAGVIAGVVFEDTVRRLSRQRGMSEAGSQLDAIISALVTAQALTPIQAKRARASAAVRTSATHAQWEEFSASDVQSVITFTRELIETKLGVSA